MSEIVFWRNLLHDDLVSDMTFATFSGVTLSTSTSRINIPLDIPETITVDKFEAYLNSGASTDFRARIVTSDATTGDATDTLVHANASLSIAATSGAWNVFDFTNFDLSAGKYWISLDSPATPSTALAVQYSIDYITANLNTSSGRILRYWTGSALAKVPPDARALRARLKSTDGWVPIYPLAPLPGASGLNWVVMDTLENPACRGNRFIAPASGKIIGFDVSKSVFTSSTSFYLVLATEGCGSELARTEEFAVPSGSTAFIHRVKIPAVSVVAGTSYDVYVKAGSQATTSGGIGITALDTSEDSGNVISCYGVTPGDIKGLYVHDPATEGGVDVPTTTLDHVFPWVPVYSEITTSSGGGGETAHVFAA